MDFNYTSILSDFKKAKQTITSLRQERDDLRELSLKLEEKNKKLLRKLEVLTQENKTLNDICTTKASYFRNYDLIRPIEELSKELKLVLVTSKNAAKFNTEKIIEHVQQGKIDLTLKTIIEVFLDYLKSIKNQRKSFSFYNKSSEELETEKEVFEVSESYDEDEQGSKISSISKNISKLINNNISNNTSKSELMKSGFY